MKKPTLLALLLLLATSWINAQQQSLLIQKKSGELLTMPVSEIDTITFVTTGNVQRNKWYFMLENPGVADYLRDFEYDSQDYSYHRIFDYRGEPYLDTRQDWPYGVELNDTLIYNLIPNRRYTIQTSCGATTIQTVGQLRMLKLQGVNNIRDLGGWPTSNGKVLRYGCVVRGPELNTTLPTTDASARYHRATPQDIVTLREDIGIKAELDLRGPMELPLGPDGAARSVLGPEITYQNHPNCSTAPLSGPDGAWIAPMRFILNCLSQEHPVYVHCRWGADRTGLLCMLMEGLLGVCESNLAKDFELTSFAGDSRFRTDTRFRSSIAYIKSLPGDSLQQQFRHYWLTCGANEDELDKLTMLMTE